MQYGLIGRHLPHSFSGIIHGLIGRYTSDEYEFNIHEIEPEDLDAFLLSKDFKGINVTIPYKEKVIPYLDHIDDAAKAIGAVNTIVNKDNKLYGYNTDYYGLRDLIVHTGIKLKDKKVTILGTGGTSKTARYVCKSLGAASIVIVSRNKPSCEDDNNDSGYIYSTYDEVYDKHSDTDVIINTTPVGMYPKAGISAIDLEGYNNLSGVIDVIYNPLKTALVLDAEDKNIPCCGGLRMLVTQAVYGYKLFMGKSVTDDDIADIIGKVYKDVYTDKLNLVLIGMPGCGKSTVGRRLVKTYNKQLIDTDELITDKEGRPITDIFADSGEEYFRDIESAVIDEVSATGGKIISTGGGAILRNNNIRALRSNGILIFLDRPLEDLIPTSDRPLSSDITSLRKRYEERYDIYTSAADIRITDTDTTEEAIENYL
ncbi:MAG: shikimate dehydrogenase [Lachnospiraceae bacterium]|nr:shikimate dehydrogenase [Lachnospiraceae bacterium]